MLGWNFLPLPVPHHVPKAGLGVLQAVYEGSICQLPWHLGRGRHQLTSAAREAAGTEDWQRARGEGCVQAADLPASASCLCLPL